MQSVRAVVHDLLRDLGMSTVFGNPGSTELPFLRDFPADFRYVLGLSEAAVVGMADGFAQAGGQAAFVSLHSASGPGQAMGAVVNAYHNRAPLVIMSGQQDRRHLAIEPYLFARSVELVRPYVKWAMSRRHPATSRPPSTGPGPRRCTGQAPRSSRCPWTTGTRPPRPRAGARSPGARAPTRPTSSGWPHG